MRSFGPLLDTSAIRGENMKHSYYKKGTSPPRELPDLSILPCAYHIRKSAFALKTNLKTLCCFRQARMRMTSLPIQLSQWRAQWENIVPAFPRGSFGHVGLCRRLATMDLRKTRISRAFPHHFYGFLKKKSGSTGFPLTYFGSDSEARAPFIYTYVILLPCHWTKLM